MQDERPEDAELLKGLASIGDFELAPEPIAAANALRYAQEIAVEGKYDIVPRQEG